MTGQDVKRADTGAGHLPATREDLFMFLNQSGITTSTVSHAPVVTVAEAQSVRPLLPAGGHCKNLFCKDEGGQLWLLVCLEDARVELKAVPALIKSKRLSFAKPEVLRAVLGVEPGAVTPFGLINDKARRVRVALDSAMMQHDVLHFHPLHNDATTAIRAADLLTFIKACGHDLQVVGLATPAL